MAARLRLEPLPGCYTVDSVLLSVDSSVAGRITAGRAAGCEIRLPSDGRLSSQHFYVTLGATPGALSVTDTSTNGTFLNGSRIPKGSPQPLAVGDVITAVVPSKAVAAKDASLAKCFVGFTVTSTDSHPKSAGAAVSPPLNHAGSCVV